MHLRYFLGRNCCLETRGAQPEPITPRIAAGAWYRTEDSWAIALGVGLVAAAVLALVNGSSIKWLAVTPQKWSSPDQLGQQFSVNAGRYLALFVLWISLFGLSTRALGIRALQFPALRASLPARSAAPRPHGAARAVRFAMIPCTSSARPRAYTS